MRIAFDMQPLFDDEKTGVGYYGDELARGLIKANPGSKFVLNYFAFRNAPQKRGKAEKYAAGNTEFCECRFFPARFYRLLSALLPMPYSLFFRNNADLTHFFNYIVPPFVKGKAAVTIHDMVLRRFPETMSFKTRKMLELNLAKTIRRADLVLTDSEFSKKEILHFYNCAEGKIEVIYAGVDRERYAPDVPAGEIERAKLNNHIKGEYILYLGTLEPRKNIERLIEAYAALKKGRDNIPVLVIAGRKGWLFETIFERVKRLNVEDSVIFTGYVSDADKPALLAGAKFFCFPSLYEGFGMPPLEAMACGTPVLASNAASLPEVCGDAAVLVDPYSAEEIAKGMETLCFDAGLREELRKKGLGQAARFDWADSAGKLYKLYAGVTEKHK